jgi:hypothetical protein
LTRVACIERHDAVVTIWVASGIYFHLSAIHPASCAEACNGTQTGESGV